MMAVLSRQLRVASVGCGVGKLRGDTSLRGAVGSSNGVSLYDIQMYDYGLTIHFVRSLLWEWRGLEFYGMIPFSS